MNIPKNLSQVGYISLTCKLAQDGEQWTGECIELGTATYGDTEFEVWEELKELITLHLTGLEEEGESERFFKENGITVYPFTQQPQQQPFTIGGGIFPEIYPVHIPQYAIA